MLNAIRVFMIFLFLSMSVALAIGISGLMFFPTRSEMSRTILIQKSLSTIQSLTILAISPSILAGNLTNNTGITSRLAKLVNALIGYMYGFIGQASVVLSTLMGGVLGSAAADVTMECRIPGPEMTKHGYAPGWSAAINCLSELVVAIAPPSVGLTLYDIVGEVFIGRLFIVGFVPGSIMCIFMMITAPWPTRHLGYKPDHEEPFSFREIGKVCIEGIWALFFPAILIVLIRDRVMTPSESGAFAVFYALAVGVLVYRELTWEKFKECLTDSVRGISVTTVVPALSGISSYGVMYDQLPKDVASFLVDITDSPTIMLFLIIIMLTACGVFMETTVITPIVTSILLPVIRQYGIDPVQFEIIMMTAVTTGCSTPSVDAILCTCSFTMDCPVEETTKYSWPLPAAIFGTLLIHIFPPGPTLFLSNLVYGPSM